MAHFARIDETNTVTEVLVIPDEQEHRGQDFLANDLGLGGTWIQTSYNNRIRKRFAGIGCTYDPKADVFIGIQPAPWFYLNDNHDWVCPEGINPETGNPYTEQELDLLAIMQLQLVAGNPVYPGDDQP